ncbi:bifunctional UDP-N-acetylglucosamine diphosphorylase/glucosamine-1-phosphate N-acetyltransferase GlmU [Fusobacterium perfoetens]|uniref:bifunctional UDP-N-acetylglucosamine diphosphorylase/glucosamine-1-phosphate N-acetyltransferase GlmU n=1 Tax=Fusobacterium perfoetens TaxID=852 RepID=UPI001F27F19B|nr:bifunctional UDP-N-acetylglucosamine diphosphorylase/glucosamine-1-phosphate N-acetyltransferase GlmU [Fusobacterium perfoetens]MCF2624901.1 bifunctional UDP-N-acetylglucosamine diphosphorylase/glucosamine-1-phosphate N-acetyltransferase GlmU [Fusobacterium perfoetens]
MKLKTLILAAGKGTRMKSDLPKVIHKVNGIPMVKKILNELEKLGTEENILILGHKKEEILKELGEIKYAVQEEQLGTGHAIMQAENLLKDYEGDVMILYGDTPLLRHETLKAMYEAHKKSGVATTILTSVYENPFGYGRIVKNGEKVTAIVEEKEADEETKKIKEVNAGVYCCNAKELFAALKKVTNNNEKGEYYLTDIVGIQVGEGKTVASFVLEDNREILGVNSKVELAEASKILRERKNTSLMEEGVILIDPASTYIEETVKIGRDTVIYPTVMLQGNTVIGENCEIIGCTRIIDSTLGNDIRIESSVIEESIVDDKVTMGPFAHLRPKSHLKEKVHIGNFVEVKKSTLEYGVKAGHLTYLGNATVGKDTNIGAGTITCNYDGVNKFDTVIGENVFIGSDTMLVAPVNIGDKAITGAGSVITKDVAPRALAVERSKQIIKFEWRK